MRLARTLSLIALLWLAAPLAAQEVDLQELFSNDRFYRESGVLRAHGDVPFLADVWFLPGTADSTRALIGVSLSNSALRFVRQEGAGWRATYRVVARLDPEEGSEIERRWEKTVDIGSFDESLLTGETIVFQTELALVPGEYDLRLTVEDAAADEFSRVSTKLDVPRLAAPALAEPVLLRRFERRDGDVEYVVHPSHSFPAPPERIQFMLTAAAPATGGPFVARARLVDPRAGEDAAPLATWSDSLSPADGGWVAFGSLENKAQFGEFRLEATLADASGGEIARGATPLLIGGSAAWVAEHWKEALSLIKYEATEKELDILEDIGDPAQRIEAWACFWRMRDPVEASPVNEAMQDYFSRLQTANENWKSALRSGYLSDRGRVYVTLGPPDDIQSNPMPGGSEAYEIWTYQRDRQFQILFVDRIGFNNYQLESLSTYQRELSLIDRRKRSFLKMRSHYCPLLAPAFEEE